MRLRAPSPAGGRRRSSKRAKVLHRRRRPPRGERRRFAVELTREEGKPLALAKDEFLRSAQTLRFYAVEGQSFAGETFPQDDPDMVGLHASASRSAS